MKRTLFITGTDTGVGKTVLTALLARFLCERGVKVAAAKPVCSGGRDDARRLHDALRGVLTLDEINPWHFRKPIAPSIAAKLENKSVKLVSVLAHLRALQEQFEVLLVEGAGGLLSPLGENFNSRDVIVALRAIPIIVAQNRLGAVNHVLLTLEALPAVLASRALVVLMSPSRLDVAAKTNASLLSELFTVGNVITIPWLGSRFSMDTTLKSGPVRRGLEQLIKPHTAQPL